MEVIARFETTLVSIDTIFWMSKVTNLFLAPSYLLTRLNIMVCGGGGASKSRGRSRSKDRKARKKLEKARGYRAASTCSSSDDWKNTSDEDARKMPFL